MHGYIPKRIRNFFLCPIPIRMVCECQRKMLVTKSWNGWERRMPIGQYADVCMCRTKEKKEERIVGMHRHTHLNTLHLKKIVWNDWNQCQTVKLEHFLWKVKNHFFQVMLVFWAFLCQKSIKKEKSRDSFDQLDELYRLVPNSRKSVRCFSFALRAPYLSWSTLFRM